MQQTISTHSTAARRSEPPPCCSASADTAVTGSASLFASTSTSRRQQRRGGELKDEEKSALGGVLLLLLSFSGLISVPSQQEARASIRAACRHLRLLGWVPISSNGLGWVGLGLRAYRHEKPLGHGQGREGRRRGLYSARGVPDELAWSFCRERGEREVTRCRLLRFDDPVAACESNGQKVGC